MIRILLDLVRLFCLAGTLSALVACAPRFPFETAATATLPPNVDSALRTQLEGEWQATSGGHWNGGILRFDESGVFTIGGTSEADAAGSYAFVDEDTIAFRFPESSGTATLEFENRDYLSLEVKLDNEAFAILYSAERLTDQASPSQANQGGDLFNKMGCPACHSLPSAGAASEVGPSLVDMSRTAQLRLQDTSYTGAAITPAEYVKESITHPSAYIVEGYNDFMPGYSTFSDEELDILVEFLVGLSEP